MYRTARDGTALAEAVEVLERASNFPRDWWTTPQALGRQAEARMLQATHDQQAVRLARGMAKMFPEAVDSRPATVLPEVARELDTAVELGRRALAFLAADDPRRCTALSVLAVVLSGRAEFRETLEDLGEVIALLREAIATGPADSPDQPIWRTNLLATLLQAHAADACPTLLDEAEALAREAAAMTPARSAAHARALVGLANVLNARDANGRETTAERLALLFRAHRAPALPLIERFHAAREAARLAARLEDWATAADQSEAAVDLLVHLIGHQLVVADREDLLAEELEVAGFAAACSLHLCDPMRALRLLEQGRGILLKRMTETRRDIAELHRQSPALAEEFTRIGAALAMVGGETALYGSDLDEHRLTTRSWEQVCEKIRVLPGFQTFLRYPVPEVGALTASGPVVVVNVSSLRTDAIVLADGRVWVVPLPGADSVAMVGRLTTFDQATDDVHASDLSAEDRMRAAAAIGDTLGWLWERIAEPVLGSLGLLAAGLDASGEGPLPRLWWCPTGMLSFLPLHAAGTYSARTPHGVADYVVSSYTSTLNALHASSTRPPHSRTDAPSLLVVATPEVAGQRPLTRADEDAGALAQLFPGASVLSGPQATREAVLRELTTHSWAHFACHASRDRWGRAANRLLVDDGELSIHDIAALTVDAELAFLAACGTAAGALFLADEAQHIASAFQLAGYRQVIATLWKVTDDDASEVTMALYRQLRAGVPPAEAVHSVTRSLRDRYPRSPWLWAPYLHVGA
ncbi:CHAT domain-containing protein [Kitasatospora aureofaciens]|uniref:CHAT domain-containing protein n=1 Tax=Kitasatospora aureofaciens TaxID=1894 RepID=UPI00068B528A|nr:CHAT domain-containing protein [Kitasatospora aureofaciens]